MSTLAPQPEALAPPAPPKRFPPLLRLFEPAPPAAVTLTDPAQIKKRHTYWQWRMIIATTIGYGAFYLVRKNLSIAMPVMETTLHIDKAQLGAFLTLHGLLYGVSKFINGFFGDRCHVRTFMVTGLVLSSTVNVFFGFSSAVVAFGIFWMVNGWFQGMGFPPCARAFTHWVRPNELATKMALWNFSHNLGAGLVVVICSYLITYYHNWRLCFLVPAALAFLCSAFLWFALPDTPPSVGLPEVEGTRARPAPHDSQHWLAVAVKHVFSNPWIWLLAIANFFVYTIRYTMLDWGPTMLKQSKGLELTQSGWIVAGYELAGFAGTVLGGWITDRLFGGRCFRSCVFYMAMTGVSVWLFWKVAGNSPSLNAVFLCVTGFFIYGPQSLIGIAASNLATKRAAATAVGLTGFFGYASTTLSGWGVGKLVKTCGWDAMFIGLLIVSAIGTVICAVGWKARAHGYGD